MKNIYQENVFLFLYPNFRAMIINDLTKNILRFYQYTNSFMA